MELHERAPNRAQKFLDEGTCSLVNVRVCT
jgi:hypothetical protein